VNFATNTQTRNAFKIGRTFPEVNCRKQGSRAVTSGLATVDPDFGNCAVVTSLGQYVENEAKV
jgi:hypothetical protein